MEFERLVCHPRLPLIAGLQSDRPAVHIWDGDLDDLTILGAGSQPYSVDDFGHDRRVRTPGVAWHPHEPLLLIPTPDGVIRWTPTGITTEPGGAYRWLGFTPDGRTLLASPSAAGKPEWDQSDVLDVASGAVGIGPGWDTGAVPHPAGEIVATLRTDQGATLVVFAHPAGTALRLLSRAVIVNVDGYTPPVFSPDGRYFALRGNNYVHSLDVYAFPSLRRVLQTTLGDLDEPWSWHNIAFGTEPGRLFIGTPSGTLIECDLELGSAAELPLPSPTPVTALATMADGSLVLAGGETLRMLQQPTAPAADPATVRDFLAGAPPVREDEDLEEQLVLTDGEQEWGSDELDALTEASDQDPAWLQRRAAINQILE
ncbi:TolB family protein [Dactylosporangium sp. CS-047395]|uniref:TolB family protein n=1 Tax=Dactylosporangium sp. CS-047395 TaxID=3239936 RepID=UPI003D8C89AD